MSSEAAPIKPRSDLGIRTLSGAVMMAAAGLAIWAGSWLFLVFVILVGAGVIWEWWGLASKIARTPIGAALWLAAGVAYVSIAMAVLVALREQSATMALLPIVLVIAVDVSAYFAGRAIGGPKIAPRISPNKTWAGLLGGCIGSVMALTAFAYFFGSFWQGPVQATWIVGPIVAFIAQAGDFFESWMKRRAGVKDSGSLIPGHGGVFDRTDGLIAVLFVSGLVFFAHRMVAG